MKPSRGRVENILDSLGLYRPVRVLYRVILGRKANRIRTQIRQFYSHLLSPGDLVFDVGANVGTYSEIFASLGARVVAVEPQPHCVRHIRLSNPDGKIEVIEAVAGARGGVASLRIANSSDLSSMSDDWIHLMQKTRNKDDNFWARQITIPVICLDSLHEKYGLPKFIKIDVEGYEEHVLDGLSWQPPLLCFEYHTGYLDATMRCLEKKVIGKRSLFNFVVGEPFRFELDKWTDLPGLKASLTVMSSGHGDIFVSRTA